MDEELKATVSCLGLLVVKYDDHLYGKKIEEHENLIHELSIFFEKLLKFENVVTDEDKWIQEGVSGTLTLINIYRGYKSYRTLKSIYRYAKMALTHLYGKITGIKNPYKWHNISFVEDMLIELEIDTKLMSVHE